MKAIFTAWQVGYFDRIQGVFGLPMMRLSLGPWVMVGIRCHVLQARERLEILFTLRSKPVLFTDLDEATAQHYDPCCSAILLQLTGRSLRASFSFFSCSFHVNTIWTRPIEQCLPRSSLASTPFLL
jgi:hypothetical protein